MSYLDVFSYANFFDDQPYKFKSKFMCVPDDIPLEEFIIDIDVDDDTNDELEEVKVEDVGCEELRVDMKDDAEIYDFIQRATSDAAFEFYCEWYANSFYGTLEHPIPLFDENDELLTARSYYNCKNNKMVEMKIVFNQCQLDQTKTFLQQIGFSFDKIDMSLFNVSSSETGCVENPHIYNNADGEMLTAYNCYQTESDKDNKTMCEMRLVFDGEQYEIVIQSLRAGGFNI
jgi:hypothetical protein